MPTATASSPAVLLPNRPLRRLLGLKGIRAEICFGGEVRERGDRFVLSEGARGVVMEMYAGSDVEKVGEAELVEAP
jgi:hypothetical protein